MARFIAPSILASDFGNLEHSINVINNSEAGWLHCDVMDGIFVPNISFGMPVVEYAAKKSKKPLDVHLMIVEPERYISTFCQIGVDILTIHYEASRHLHRSVQQIKELGVKAGVALNPHTPVNLLEDIIADLDLVLIMSVNPGFGGQKLIENSFAKISRLKELILHKKADTLIEVDGGIGPLNASRFFNAGADILVAGTSVFGSVDPGLIINQMLIS